LDESVFLAGIEVVAGGRVFPLADGKTLFLDIGLTI